MKNRKIQLRLYPNEVGKTNKTWYLQYRVDPSELKWYQKIFNNWSYVWNFNKIHGTWWRTIVFESYDSIFRILRSDTAENQLGKYRKKLKTEEDILNWNNEQKKLEKQYKRDNSKTIIY